MRTRWVLLVLLALGIFAFPAFTHAQGPITKEETFALIVRLVVDTLQGQTTNGADALFAQAKQSATNLLNNPAANWFFLDFGNPNLRLNQFAAEVARNLLVLTPLYFIGYLFFLIYAIWRERPIPNPVLYTVLVLIVMIFLGGFAMITQGLGATGRALVLALGGAGDAFDPRVGLANSVVRVLILLQKNGGVISIVALFVAIVESIVILIQLAYRGLTLAIWRLVALLLIPLSVLLEGTNPQTAGKTIAGFFEAWLDIVGKLALLFIVLGIASSEAYANTVWFVLPAGLLVVISSWLFFGILFRLIRDAGARAWSSFAPAAIGNTDAPLPASIEASRAREIDAARKRTLGE